jgi:hypothetical protein
MDLVVFTPIGGPDIRVVRYPGPIYSAVAPVGLNDKPLEWLHPVGAVVFYHPVGAVVFYNPRVLVGRDDNGLDANIYH